VHLVGFIIGIYHYAVHLNVKLICNTIVIFTNNNENNIIIIIIIIIIQ